MRRNIISTAVAVVLQAAFGFSANPTLEFDHAWIMVTAGAPERTALEKAGFKISPNVNHHEGQGTSSVTAEFQNSFLELMWPDPNVSVAPGREAAVEKFRQRMLWRSSGWCPIGIGLRRAVAADTTPMPFPTWTISLPWMPPGSGIEMLTARDDTKSPSLFIPPRSLEVNESANREKIRRGAAEASMFAHPNKLQRITAIRLVSPKTYKPVEAITYLEKAGVFELRPGQEWLLELTFDNGKKRETKDLRPDLPLIVHY